MPSLENRGGRLKSLLWAYIAANERISISYRSKTDEARCSSATSRRLQRKRKVLQYKANEFGPPDKRCYFEPSKNTEETTTIVIDDSTVSIHSNLHPEVIGKRVKVKYEEDGGCQSFQGVIISYNCMTGKYAVFFPSDKTSEEFSIDEDGFMVID